MIGVKFPFTITGGSIATTSNPAEIIGSQVTFCLGTMIGERLMRPTWGVDIINTVHSIGADLDVALPEAIRNAFSTHFPDYEPREIEIIRRVDNPAYVDIDVKFGHYDSDIDMLVRVGTQLPDGTEIYANEGL